MSQTGDKKVRRDGNVCYYKGKCFTKGVKGIGALRIIMWVMSGSWKSMSHEQYKHDKDCGNVVGLGGDVVG